MNPFAEQEAWEEHQIGKCHFSEDLVMLLRQILKQNYPLGKATMKFGSKNKKQSSDDYQ